MDRRTLLRAVAGARPVMAGAGVIAAPALAQDAAASTLRFVPQGNLANIDPVWSATVLARNAGLMV